MDVNVLRVAVLTASNRASTGIYEGRGDPAQMALVRDVVEHGIALPRGEVSEQAHPGLRPGSRVV